MGLFTKKNRQETRSILPSKKTRSIFIKKVASSSSTDDDSLSYDKKRTSSSRKQPKAKFSRLNDDKDETTAEYIPPPGFIPFPNDAFDVKHEPQICTRVKSSDSQSEASQIVKQTLSENSSSSFGYEPPVFPIHPPKKATFSILSSPDPVESARPLKNPSTFQATFPTTSKSAEKFDAQSHKTNTGLYFTNNASISRSSDSGFPTPLGGQDFQQIVFDDQFQKIEKVAVAKSDVEGSDFSDFVHAASQLATMFSPDKNAVAKTALEHPVVPTTKTTLNSYTSSTVCPPESLSSKEQTFVAPSSVPQRRMKTSTNAASNDWLRYKTVEESLQRSCVDGFSVSSYNSNNTTAKSRQEFQEAIRSKPRTPLQMRTEALHARRPGRVHISSDRSSVGETTNISLTNATFSNPSTASIGSNERKAVEVDFDSDDPFHVGETASSSWNENDDFAAWDTTNNPFEHVKASKPDVVQGRIVPSVSMDDGLIASIRRSATKRSASTKDPDGESMKRDPSPRGDIRSISSDSRLEYNHSGSAINTKRTSSNSIGPQKTPPKAVTANAILGSMLFRLCDQSQSQAPMTSSVKQQSTTVSKSPKSSRSIVKYGHGVDDSSGGHANCKVPRELRAEEGSDVSSVTEEASSFYQKNFVSSSQWSRQAHEVLNHYNVRKTLQLRDENARARVSRVHHTTPPLSRLEEDHANMFQCEM